MKRRDFLVGSSAALALCAGAALAQQSPLDALIARLKAEGYTRIRVRRTWLGRMQIRARKDKIRREIVLNPVTGEILRDFNEERDDDDFDFFDLDDAFEGKEIDDDDDDDHDDD